MSHEILTPVSYTHLIAETVASPLEESINGVENMLYMQSQANSDGNRTLTVNFKLGVDPDKAQQLVQNRVSQALPRLPPDVQRLGVTTTKSSPTPVSYTHLQSLAAQPQEFGQVGAGAVEPLRARVERVGSRRRRGGRRRVMRSGTGHRLLPSVIA